MGSQRADEQGDNIIIEVEIEDDSISHPCRRCGEVTDGYSCKDCWKGYYRYIFNSDMGPNPN